MLLHYILQGHPDDAETGIQSSFVLANKDTLSLAQLQDLFPFYGSYHFRLRVADSAGAAGFVWLDVTRENDDLIELATNFGGVTEDTVFVKALPLSFDAPAGAEQLPAGEEPYQLQHSHPAKASNRQPLSSTLHNQQQQPQHSTSANAQKDSNFAEFDDSQFEWEEVPASPEFASKQSQMQQQQQHVRAPSLSGSSGHGSNSRKASQPHSRRSSRDSDDQNRQSHGDYGDDR